MGLYDKWDVDFIKSHKQLSNISIWAFYYENDPDDSVTICFTWSNEVDDAIGDSVFEALNRTPCLGRSFPRYAEYKQFLMKLDRNNAIRIATGLEVDIDIRKPEEIFRLDAA